MFSSQPSLDVEVPQRALHLRFFETLICQDFIIVMYSKNGFSYAHFVWITGGTWGIVAYTQI
jgi:hypothetical protein